MKFFNDYDIQRAREAFAHHEVLNNATALLQNVALDADENSDGWHSWPLPCRASKQLIELIEAAYKDPSVGTQAAFKKAAAPIKAFYTRIRAKVPRYPAYPGAL